MLAALLCLPQRSKVQPSKQKGDTISDVLAGLKFALGLAAGLSHFSGTLLLLLILLIAMDRLVGWRKKRRRHLQGAKARASQRTMPRFRERVVFQFFYRSDDWIPVPDKSEYTQ